MLFPQLRAAARARIFKALAAFGLLVLMSACFTGIEGTPRIGPRGSEASGQLSAERELALRIEPQPISLWTEGKLFRVTDERAAIAFSLPSASELVGRDIAFSHVRPAMSLTGDSMIEMLFTAPAGDTLTLRARPAVRPQVPFTAELSVAAAADSLLRGQRLFIVTPMWYDAAGRGTVASGLRHVAVKVDSVVPGTDAFPARVVFTPEGSEEQYAVYMSAAEGTRPFDALFAFTDPRERYTSVTDATWALIVRSRVAEGMTRDECRLAWGAPSMIRQLPTTAGMVEQWSYDDGRYLIFEDALLARFRQ